MQSAVPKGQGGMLAILGEKIENIKGVEKVLETYGIYDIIIEAYTDNNMQKVIEGLVGKDMIEISPLIVG